MVSRNFFLHNVCNEKIGGVYFSVAPFFIGFGGKIKKKGEGKVRVKGKGGRGKGKGEERKGKGEK